MLSILTEYPASDEFKFFALLAARHKDGNVSQPVHLFCTSKAKHLNNYSPHCHDIWSEYS